MASYTPDPGGPRYRRSGLPLLRPAWVEMGVRWVRDWRREGALVLVEPAPRRDRANGDRRCAPGPQESADVLLVVMGWSGSPDLGMDRRRRSRPMRSRWASVKARSACRSPSEVWPHSDAIVRRIMVDRLATAVLAMWWFLAWRRRYRYHRHGGPGDDRGGRAGVTFGSGLVGFFDCCRSSSNWLPRLRRRVSP